MSTQLGFLFTDLYELTMAQAYWACDRADDEAAFHLFYRRPPATAAGVVACGQHAVRDWLDGLRFQAEDLKYLAALPAPDGSRLFRPAFLDWLGGMRLDCQVDAVAEGTLVFPNTPLMRVIGPLPQAQLLESALLNLTGFASLVATKAALIRQAVGDDPVLEFGLRRAQGPDGARTATRSAYIGGVDSTSNTLAGQALGIPVAGTHAHSWVMSFRNERDAFAAYAQSSPNNVILLVDTYDTAQGIRNAIDVGHQLQRDGGKLAAIRLDSGDLAEWARHARQALDAAGMTDTRIVASGDLDATRIRELKRAHAPIDIWGVGTQLVTGGDQPALDVVYKLAAIRRHGESDWRPRMKLSNTPAKQTLPGIQQVRRYTRNGTATHDVVYDPGDGLPPTPGGADSASDCASDSDVDSADLLQPLMRDGQPAGPAESLATIRQRARAQAAAMLTNHDYPITLAEPLQARARELQARLGKTDGG